MKVTFSLTAVQNGARRILMGLVVAVVIFLQHNAAAIPTVDLGTAGNFAVLAGTTITVAAPVNSGAIIRRAQRAAPRQEGPQGAPRARGRLSRRPA